MAAARRMLTLVPQNTSHATRTPCYFNAPQYPICLAMSHAGLDHSLSSPFEAMHTTVLSTPNPKVKTMSSMSLSVCTKFMTIRCSPARCGTIPASRGRLSYRTSVSQIIVVFQKFCGIYPERNDLKCYGFVERQQKGMKNKEKEQERRALKWGRVSSLGNRRGQPEGV